MAMLNNQRVSKISKLSAGKGEACRFHVGFTPKPSWFEDPVSGDSQANLRLWDVMLMGYWMDI